MNFTTIKDLPQIKIAKALDVLVIDGMEGTNKIAVEDIKEAFIGPQGPVGPRGPQGDKGDIGLTGAKGDKGDKGDTGLTGPQGEIGPRGIQGEIGPQGIKGDKGDIGLTGPQGIKGDKGDTGSQGAKGDKGDKGDTGLTGPQGIKGDKGEIGPKGDKGDTGLTGPQGIKGDKGDTGSQGAKGDKGDKGDIGLTGPQGIKGDVGQQGLTGNIGLTGKSAYQIAIDNGFNGSESDWITSLHGINGSDINYDILNEYNNTNNNIITNLSVLDKENMNTDPSIIVNDTIGNLPINQYNIKGATVKNILEKDINYTIETFTPPTRNLLYNTTDPINLAAWQGMTVNSPWFKVVRKQDIKPDKNIYCIENDTSGEQYVYQSIYINNTEDTYYTVSCDMYIESDVSTIEIFVLGWNNSGTMQLANSKTYSTYNKWIRVKNTVLVSKDITQLALRLDNNGSSGPNNKIYFTNVQMEIGKDATPFIKSAGRNLIDNSSNFPNGNNWSILQDGNSSGSFTLITDSNMYNMKGIEFTIAKKTDFCVLYNNSFNNYKFEKDKHYTVSYIIGLENVPPVGFDIKNQDATHSIFDGTLINATAVTTKKYFATTETFTASEIGDLPVIRFYTKGSAPVTNGKITIYQIKLEKNINPTDYNLSNKDKTTQTIANYDLNWNSELNYLSLQSDYQSDNTYINLGKISKDLAPYTNYNFKYEGFGIKDIFISTSGDLNKITKNTVKLGYNEIQLRLNNDINKIFNTGKDLYLYAEYSTTDITGNADVRLRDCICIQDTSFKLLPYNYIDTGINSNTGYITVENIANDNGILSISNNNIFTICIFTSNFIGELFIENDKGEKISIGSYDTAFTDKIYKIVNFKNKANQIKWYTSENSTGTVSPIILSGNYDVSIFTEYFNSKTIKLDNKLNINSNNSYNMINPKNITTSADRIIISNINLYKGIKYEINFNNLEFDGSCIYIIKNNKFVSNYSYQIQDWTNKLMGSYYFIPPIDLINCSICIWGGGVNDKFTASKDNRLSLYEYSNKPNKFINYERNYNKIINIPFDTGFNGLGTVYDEIDLYNNKIIQRIGKFVIDGSTNMEFRGNDQFRVKTVGIGIKNTFNIPSLQNNTLSNFMVYGGNYFLMNPDDWWNRDEECLSVVDFIELNINRDKLSKIDIPTIQKYLQDNPVTLYYPLQTPIEYNITENIDTLYTYINKTNIVNSNTLINSMVIDVPVKNYTNNKEYTDISNRITKLEDDILVQSEIVPSYSGVLDNCSDNGIKDITVNGYVVKPIHYYMGNLLNEYSYFIYKENSTLIRAEIENTITTSVQAGYDNYCKRSYYLDNNTQYTIYIYIYDINIDKVTISISLDDKGIINNLGSINKGLNKFTFKTPTTGDIYFTYAFNIENTSIGKYITWNKDVLLIPGDLTNYPNIDYLLTDKTYDPDVYNIDPNSNLITNAYNFQNTTDWSLNDAGKNMRIVNKDGYSCLCVDGSFKYKPIPVEKGYTYIYSAEIMFTEDMYVYEVVPLNSWLDAPGVGAANGGQGNPIMLTRKTTYPANTWIDIATQFTTKDRADFKNDLYFTPIIWKPNLTSTVYLKSIQLKKVNTILKDKNNVDYYLSSDILQHSDFNNLVPNATNVPGFALFGTPSPVVWGKQYETSYNTPNTLYIKFSNDSSGIFQSFTNVEVPNTTNLNISGTLGFEDNVAGAKVSIEYWDKNNNQLKVDILGTIDKASSFNYNYIVSNSIQYSTIRFVITSLGFKDPNNTSSLILTAIGNLYVKKFIYPRPNEVMGNSIVLGHNNNAIDISLRSNNIWDITSIPTLNSVNYNYLNNIITISNAYKTGWSSIIYTFNLEPNTDYIINSEILCSVISNKNYGETKWIAIRDKDSGNLILDIPSGNGTFNTGKYSNVNIGVFATIDDGNITNTNYIKQLFLCKKSEYDNKIEKYIAPINISIPLKESKTLNKINKVYDTYDSQLGLVIKRTNTALLDGSQDWSIHNYNTAVNILIFINGWSFLSDAPGSKSEIMCDTFNTLNGDTIESYVYGYNNLPPSNEEGIWKGDTAGTGLFFWLRKDRFKTLDNAGIKEFFKNNPTTVTWEVKNPTSITIDKPIDKFPSIKNTMIVEGESTYFNNIILKVSKDCNGILLDTSNTTTNLQQVINKSIVPTTLDLYMENTIQNLKNK